MSTVTKKENGWLKFARIVIYAVTIIGVTVGLSLIKVGRLSVAYANGTYAAKIQNGEIIFWIAFIILCGNIVWGVLRWFLRGYREKWRPGRIIGKLIGGGIWRIVAIVPLVLISLFLITPKISNAIVANVSNDDNTKKIALSEPLDHLEYISEHLEDYSVEELEEELAPYLFTNIDFDIDASSNVTSKKPSGIFTENVSAYSSTVKILNKAKLSSNGRFVVFYTDTGDDKISDAKADELAEMLESVISGYQNNLGFLYSYKRVVNNVLSISKMEKVLENSGINENALDAAMPVYIVNPYKDGSSTLASYAGERWRSVDLYLLSRLGALFGEETTKLYNSTPSYPFINILPENVSNSSLAIVSAHELGHHYSAIYNYEHYSSDLGSTDDFINETAPNWMAINVLPGQPSDNLINSNHYNRSYLGEATGKTISDVATDFLGYPAVAFLENYYEIVPNAKTIIMDGAYKGDALNYLYDQAGADNFEKVMVSLAEKNLTGNYGGKLINYTLPKGDSMSCADLCSKEAQVNPAATGYVYFDTGQYLDTKIQFRGNEQIIASVVGKDVRGNWKVLVSGQNEFEFDLSEDIARQYEVVAIAVANGSISETRGYHIDVVSYGFDDLIAATGEFDFEGIYKDLGHGCYEINVSSLFDTIGQMMDLSGELINVITSFDLSNDYSEVKNEWSAEVTEAKSNLEEVKQTLDGYIISVCANYVDSGLSFDEAKVKLQDAMGYNINFYDGVDDGVRTSIFAGFDLLIRQGRVYMLVEYEGEIGLITINVN